MENGKPTAVVIAHYPSADGVVASALVALKYDVRAFIGYDHGDKARESYAQELESNKDLMRSVEYIFVLGCIPIPFPDAEFCDKITLVDHHELTGYVPDVKERILAVDEMSGCDGLLCTCELVGAHVGNSMFEQRFISRIGYIEVNYESNDVVANACKKWVFGYVINENPTLHSAVLTLIYRYTDCKSIIAMGKDLIERDRIKNEARRAELMSSK